MNPANPYNSGQTAGETPEAWDVCVVGLGYVGLPTAAVLATRGARVAGFDVQQHVVDTINAGDIHIVEPELDALVRAAVAAGSLRAMTAPAPAGAYLICVPTPLTSTTNEPELRYVEQATRAIVPVLRKGDLVVVESTIPPGTTRTVVAPILQAAGFEPGRDVFVAHAPERVLPGSVLHEVVENARVVGGLTDACTSRAVAFYEGFVRGEVHPTRACVAELVKLSENAFRDVNIAFANELANVCANIEIGSGAGLQVDPWEVIRLANHHPRVQILRPGPGVGGHCIAVDPWFIVSAAREHSPLIRTARAVNDGRPGRVVGRVLELARRFKAPRIACLGLSYKPDIDDLRESPAVEVVTRLRAAGDDLGELMLVEPHIKAPPAALEGLALVPAEEALGRADIVVILVAHRAFKRLRHDLFLGPSVVDTVGLLNRPASAGR